MCQCGQKRAALAIHVDTNAQMHSAPAARAVAMPTIRYEYTGHTGLTVFGGTTRTRYRFAHPGAQVAVDARDGGSLDSVPKLRRVSIATR
jgi:hypothetical protein